MPSYTSEIEQKMQRLYKSLNEKDRRRYAAIEAAKLGWGGISYISSLFGCDYYTIRLGLSELDDEVAMNSQRIRAEGGGRKSAFETVEGLDEAFLKVIAQHTAGSPMDESQKWTNLNRQEIADLLEAEGKAVSVTVVDQLLEKHKYRQRKAQKRLATGQNAQRNQQFENIQELKNSYEEAENPLLSMDTKKKELIGLLYREGRLYTQQEIQVFDHDWASLAEGVAIPHGKFHGLKQPIISFGRSRKGLA